LIDTLYRILYSVEKTVFKFTRINCYFLVCTDVMASIVIYLNCN